MATILVVDDSVRAMGIRLKGQGYDLAVATTPCRPSRQLARKSPTGDVSPEAGG